MKNNRKFKLIVTDAYADIFELYYSKHQYANLMELIDNSYPEDFGECKGRGLCGTCHVKTKDILTETLTNKELNTLKKVSDSDLTSRLACQIELTKELNNKKFTIITEL